MEMIRSLVRTLSQERKPHGMEGRGCEKWETGKMNQTFRVGKLSTDSALPPSLRPSSGA